MTLAEARELARRIPRRARIAQGFSRLDDMARHIRKLRALRAGRQLRPPVEPCRLRVLAMLRARLAASPELRREARQAAGYRRGWVPPVVIERRSGRPEWAGTTYRKYTWTTRPNRQGYSMVRTEYEPSDRRIVVSAAWVAARVRISTSGGWLRAHPHAVERVAAGVLAPPVVPPTPTWDAELRAARVRIERIRKERARRRVPALRRPPRGFWVRSEVLHGPHGLRFITSIRLRAFPPPGAHCADGWVRVRRAGLIEHRYTIERGAASRSVRCYIGGSDRWHWLTIVRAAHYRYDAQRYRRWLAQRRHERLLRRRARDGALIGWRRWELVSESPPEAVMLASPVRRTRWEGPVLVADGWSDSDAVRDEVGIHACHRHAPDPEIRFGGLPDHRCAAYGRVRGYGRYVLGETGWRAERVVIDLLVVHPDLSAAHIAALEQRYQCRVIVARRTARVA